jgi:NADH-quinone oxidoreductase subunit H
LFLGGGDGFSAGGIIPSWLWFIGKTFAIVFLFLWFRWTFPRLRVDRLMQFCWKFLLPWSIVNIALAGAMVLLLHK